MTEKRSVKTILVSLKPEVERICREQAQTPPPNLEGAFAGKTLFDVYRNSRLFGAVRRFKRLPLIGNALLFIKRKILKWDV